MKWVAIVGVAVTAVGAWASNGLLVYPDYTRDLLDSVHHCRNAYAEAMEKADAVGDGHYVENRFDVHVYNLTFVRKNQGAFGFNWFSRSGATKVATLMIVKRPPNEWTQEEAESRKKSDKYVYSCYLTWHE